MKPLVSILMPCRNEAGFLRVALDSLLAQEGIEGPMEILVAEGQSEDGTRAIAKSYAQRFPNVKLLDNPGRTTPAALKVLLECALGQYLVRADAHCEYPRNYVASLLPYLAEGRADVVGGVWDTVPASDTVDAKIIAACLNSQFGVGMSYRTRCGHRPVEVETVPFGAWRSDHFAHFGPFDEAFTRAQDLEHNVRVRKAGGTILCLPWLKVRYFARDSFGKLGRMAFQYGYWKIPVMLKHRTRFSVRQFGPVALVIATVPGISVGLAYPLAALPVGIYAATNLVVSLATASRDRRTYRTLLYAYAFALLHYGYGLGYLRGLWDARRGGNFHSAEVSR